MRNESESISRLRRQLLAGGAGALATGALGSLSRTAHAQAGSIDLPMINGHRNLVAFPEKRPLIVLTLGATRGNQIRAAHLLGLNRNTLRKKIRELDIPVVRGLK